MESRQVEGNLRHSEVLRHKLEVGLKPNRQSVIRELHAVRIDRERLDVTDTLSRSQCNQQDRLEAEGPDIRRLERLERWRSRTTASSHTGNSGLSVAVARLTPFMKAETSAHCPIGLPSTPWRQAEMEAK